MVEKKQNEVHKETARGLYQNPGSKPIFYVKDDPTTAEGRPHLAQFGVWASSAGRGSSAVPSGPGLVPSSLLHPARPGSQTPPLPRPGSPQSPAGARPHSPITSEAGGGLGVRGGRAPPGSSQTCCPVWKAPRVPLKDTALRSGWEGAWARTCC